LITPKGATISEERKVKNHKNCEECRKIANIRRKNGQYRDITRQDKNMGKINPICKK
jgi:hypothetical protein